MRLPLFLTCALLMACKSQSPKLSETQVLTIATNAASKHGYDLALYESRKPKYNFVRKDRTWTVLFELPQPRLGGDLIVRIQDATGNAEVLRGQ